mmetsp:Transcript_37215/g.89478  ORF Transcript_37215/g.89478 Transcript_37215/m.89478 type:complete len:168 (-) Transcript_37215:13-516(-)
MSRGRSPSHASFFDGKKSRASSKPSSRRSHRSEQEESSPSSVGRSREFVLPDLSAPSKEWGERESRISIIEDRLRKTHQSLQGSISKSNSMPEFKPGIFSPDDVHGSGTGKYHGAFPSETSVEYTWKTRNKQDLRQQKQFTRLLDNSWRFREDMIKQRVCLRARAFM